MSNIRIRQICLVAHDLDRVQGQLDAVFGIEVAHRDPGVGNYGLHNVLIPVGNQLLEIVAPKEGEHETPGGRYLKRRGGDGGYMVIMQVPKAAYAGYHEHVASDADGNPMLALDSSDIRFVPLRDGRPEGLGGLDLGATDAATAFANAEAAGCRTSDDLITIGGMRLRLV